MRLTLTNLGNEPEVVAAPDGSYTEALQPRVAVDIDGEALDVLIIGDKPDVREQIKTAGATLRALLEAIFARKTAAPQTEVVQVIIANHGGDAVRVIQGDGKTEQTVAPGSQKTLSAPGYLELRELGGVAVAPGQVEAP